MAAIKARVARRSPKPKEDAPSSKEGRGRSLWSGSLGFGLVQIPVRLLTAESHEDLSFHQLDRRDLSRIRYERVSEKTGEKVPWSRIVKGYQMPNGKFVVVDDDDFAKANVKATHEIEIQHFVDHAAIAPTYFERPYLLAPERGSAKAYGILRDAMAKKGLSAIALIVIRTRQHLCAILPLGDALVLEILRFEEDLKPLFAYAPKSPKRSDAASAKEAALAERLIESLRGEWEPKKYVDTYQKDLKRAIAVKARTGRIPTPKERRAPATGIADLVALLEKSVARGSKAKRKAAA